MSTYRAPREWARVHVVSPLIGGWAVLAGFVAVWFYLRAPEFMGGIGTDEIGQVNLSPVVMLGVAVLVLALTVGIGYLQWSFYRFKVGDDAVYLRKGVIFRQHVQARLSRLQAVDTIQPLLARIFGFAKVRIEVAGGEGSALEIAFLRTGDAEAFRNEIILLAAGRAAPVAEEADAVAAAAQAAPTATADTGGALDSFLDDAPREVATPAAAQREVYHVPLGRLFGSMALSGATVVLLISIVVGVFAVVGMVASDGENALTALGAVALGGLPAVLGLVSYMWAVLNGGFGFRAAISEDGIRLRHGMLETRRQTVPPGRVQAISLRQPLWWRVTDWWKVSVNVAGYQSTQQVATTLLPVGSRQDGLTALWLAHQDLGDPDPVTLMNLAMTGRGDDGGFIATPRRALVVDLLQWRRRGVRVTDTAVIIRQGFFARQVVVVPHERTQSLSLKQGPLQRLLGLATLHIHSTRGPVVPLAKHLDVDKARALLDSQARRARESRKRQTPEQWMAAVGLHD